MVKLPKTIFSRRLLSRSSLPETLRSDSDEKNVTYWLEKLFYQERETLQYEKFIFTRFMKRPLPEEIIPLVSHEEESTTQSPLQEPNPPPPHQVPVPTLESTFANSNRLVLRISSVFPLDMSPTQITVETIRVTIMHRQFMTSQVHSVDIKDISNVFIDSGFLSSSLTIVSRTFIENNVKVDHLRKQDANLIRNVIEGLRICEKEHIDTCNYSVEELVEKFKGLIPTHMP